jgi:non-specific serine/threonine protein kinase
VLAGGDEIILTELKDEDLLRMVALDLKSVMPE